MSTVKTGWLKNRNGEKFAPKTLTSQITTNDGVDLETKIETEILKAKSDSELYTNTKIADLINGAPTTLDTLGEIATAMGENVDVVEALEESIGKKANQSDLTAHTDNTTVHVSTSDRDRWDDATEKVDSISGGYNLGSFENKTIADLQSALDTWLNSNLGMTNASAKFSASESWITGWNSGDTTKTISAGGRWTVTVVAPYQNINYTQLRIAYYRDKQVVYVAKYNGLWQTVNYVAFKDDVDKKQNTITGGASTITSSDLTASRALVSNSSGKVAVSDVTSTELGYLDGVTSNIQTQLDNKAASSHGTHVSYGTSASALGTSSAGSASTVSRSDHVHALPALTSCTGTLSVAKGGTGATTASGAITNLGAMDLTSSQTVSGVKTFSNGIKLGEATITYDSLIGAIVFSFN